MILENAKNRIDINQTTLKEVFDFYQRNISNKRYIFKTSHGQIVFKITDDQFCHLIGIQHVVEKTSNKKQFVGKSGVDKILSGELTFKKLKSIDSKEFSNGFSERICYLPLLNNFVFKKPNLKIFQDVDTVKQTRINVSQIVFRQKQKVYIVLGLREYKYDSLNNIHYCNVISFFPDKDPILIGAQENVEIESFQIK